ncbi:2-hydroxyacyl-CoA dehydratase subunit D [Thermodesulfobacteriota bacterium]
MSAIEYLEEIYREPTLRANELKEEGSPVFGYLCAYAPVEIMTAAGVVPWRIRGSTTQPLEEATAYTESLVCPFIRSCVDRGLKGDFSFLDGFIAPHTCDALELVYRIWVYQFKPAFHQYIHIPNSDLPPSFTFLHHHLNMFRQRLEKFIGRSISDTEIQEAMAAHNENRRLLREISALRKESPPRVSGSRFLRLALASQSLDVSKANRLLAQALEELRELPPLEENRPRLLIYGSEIDDAAFLELLEGCGAWVVLDDLCTGLRAFRTDATEAEGEDVLMALARRYLEGLRCPCTHQNLPSRQRFSYLIDQAREYRVEGVLLYMMQFCDTHYFDAPDLRDMFQELGLPTLVIEDGYFRLSDAALKTRLQAFVEMISQQGD